jgi:hypothetical protein
MRWSYARDMPEILRKLWLHISTKDQAARAWVAGRFPKLLSFVDAILGSALKIISDNKFNLIVALVWVVLSMTGSVSIIVALSIAAAWLIAVLWVARADAVRKLTIPARFLLVLVVAASLAIAGLRFGNWALSTYRMQHQSKQQAPHQPSQTPQASPPQEKFPSKLRSELQPLPTAKDIALEFSRLIQNNPSKISGMANTKAKHEVNDNNTSKKESDSLKLIDNVTGESFTPKKGKIYTARSKEGDTFRFMVQDNLVYLDYYPMDGKTNFYTVLDRNGNTIDYKWPYKLEEYTVIIPEEILVKKDVITLPNGYKKINHTLKWGRKMVLIYDVNGRLVYFHSDGPWSINHSKKILSAVEKK